MVDQMKNKGHFQKGYADFLDQIWFEGDLNTTAEQEYCSIFTTVPVV